MTVPRSSSVGTAASLVAVLMRLGHRCPGGCMAAAEQLDARVWFTRHHESTQGRCGSAQVVIDTSRHHGSVRLAIRLLREINKCTATDRIHVSERRWGDAGHALAAAQPRLLKPA